MKQFEYRATVTWTGNDGSGTSTRAYGRDGEAVSPGKPTLPTSAPSDFGGDGAGWSPEDLFIAALSQCHMLTYLFVCQRAGIVVESYVDESSGTIEVQGASGGHFTEVRLRPVVTISAGDPDKALALHDDASKGCYIGASVSCAVTVDARVAAA